MPVAIINSLKMPTERSQPDPIPATLDQTGPCRALDKVINFFEFGPHRATDFAKSSVAVSKSHQQDSISAERGPSEPYFIDTLDG